MSGELPGGFVLLVERALAEDIGTGDVTTSATVDPAARGRARIFARRTGVVAGMQIAAEVYAQVGECRFEELIDDGARVDPGTTLAVAEGSFAALLIAERTALNFLQRLSGIASLTARFVAAVDGTGATIVDTRKTTPGWRLLEKAAVRSGRGANHRMALDDAYLIKENHVAAAGGVELALVAVHDRNDRGLAVEIEVRSIDELDEALASRRRPDRVLCDNFEIEMLAEAVGRARAVDPGIVIEASGNVRLDTVREIAKTGVDWISVGALTHSAPALDLSCLIEPR